MRIHRMRLANYRGVVERELTFDADGVTVIEGDNEIGKSSIAEALDLLLDHYDDTTKAAVRATKPVSRDAGAEVEVELTVGPYRCTYAKRFHRDRYTRLTITAPTPEQHTGRPAHDRMRAILAEHVDEALWKALRLHQGDALAQLDLSTQTSLATALDAACGGALGGEAESSLFERVRTEYERYFTPTGRANAATGQIVAAHEQAEAEVERLRAALARLEADSERCTALGADLERRRPRLAEQRERVRQLEARWRTLDGLRQDVARSRLSLELAEAAAREADAAWTLRQNLIAAVSRAEAERDDLEAALERTAPDLDQAEQQRRRAAQALQEARAATDRAAAVERLARADAEHHRDRFGLELLAERRARVDAAQQDLRDAAGTLERCRVDDDLLGRIEAAYAACITAQARVDGEGTHVRLVALDDVSVDVDGQRLHLSAGQDLDAAVAETLDLRLGEVARITVTAGSGVGALLEASRNADASLAALLAEAGAPGVTEARDLHRQRLDAERTVDAARQVLAENLRDLTIESMDAKLAGMRDRVEDYLERRAVATPLPEDLETARALAEDAITALERARETLGERQRDVEAAAAARATAAQGRTEISVRAEAAAEAWDAARRGLAEARSGTSDEALRAAAERAAVAVAAAVTALAAAQGRLDDEDPEGLQALRDNAQAVLDRDAADLARLEQERRDVEATLRAFGEQGLHDDLMAAERALEHTARTRQRWEARAAAARLLHDTLVRHRDQARRSYVAPFRDRITALGRVVFGPTLAVELDEDLRLATRTLHGETLAYDQLSAGAREQLTVIARLACAAVVSGDAGVPVIFDDALGYSDPARLEKLGAVFAMASRGAQVIVLTCVPDRYRHIGPAKVIQLSP
jgi:hypothetical protein